MIKFLIKNKYSNKGSMLLMTLLVLTGILSISLVSANIVIKGLKMSNVQAGSTKAYFASEAGIEKTLWEIRKNGYSFLVVDTDNVFNGSDIGNNASFQVDYATSSPNIYFTSTGMFGNTSRSVEISFLTE